MNSLRKVFASLAVTEQDRALAREITAYPATAGSAMLVLPRGVPTTARAELANTHLVTTEGGASSIPHLRVRLG